MRPRLAMFLGSCCLTLLLLAAGVRGSRTGAPLVTCNTMTPQHRGIQPQTSSPPYQLLLSKGHGRIRLVLGSVVGESYEGFLVLARDVDTGEIIGEFNNLPDTARFLECTPGVKNAVTHNNDDKKINIEFDWEAPADYEGTIIFNSTFAKTWDVFWVGVESPRITVVRRSIDIQTTPAPLTFPPVTTPPYYTPAPQNQDTSDRNPFYNGCGSTKNCFGLTNGCVAKRDCSAVVSVLVEGERYIFELQSIKAKYVAVGLSNGTKMSSDSVVECIDNDGRVSLHMSWNDGHKNFRIPTPANTVKLISSSVTDGVMNCKFSREKVTEIHGQKFDLVKNPYHLLLAAGNSLKEDLNGISYHDLGREASGEIRLSDVGAGLAAAGDLLVRLHGALMLASWVGTASVGMLLARYYRQTWVASQLCGKDQWFAWHRFFMFLTWSMTLAAFVIIFVELESWSSATYHASLGLATTILCFIQPFMAAMRPHPGAPRRVLFNWAHWFVGNASHICAIIAIFFAVRLAKAKLPEWVDWVLVAYVVFHILTHLFLTFAGCASDRQGSQRVNSFPMKDVHARNSMTHPDARRDAPHAGLRKLVFGIYFVVIVVLAVALVVITVLAPIGDSWNSLMDSIRNY